MRDLFLMEHDALSRAWPVREAEAAALLANDKRRAMLMLFAGAPRTLAEAAAEGGTVHYHVRNFCAAGLLAIVGEKRRAGRPMKLYRTVADTFFVPDECLPHRFTQTLSDELQENLTHHGFRPGRGMLFGKDSHGKSRAQRVEGDEEPSAVIDLWVHARLNANDLAVLKTELRAVVERFEQPSGSDARPYLIHAAAAPRQ